MLLADLLFTVIIAATAASILYLTALSVAAFFFRPDDSPEQQGSRLRFAVIVPAHNESLSIERCLQTIHAAATDMDLRILVLADNCSDDTAARAAAAGATVLERNAPDARGKGQALDWLLRQHAVLLADRDVTVIVDADTDVDRLFFQRMANAFACPKVRVAQGFYGTTNPEDSWRTALMGAALCVFHHLRPAGRTRLGGTAGLRGNGMAFRTRLLLERGWPAHSVIEDWEFTLRLLLDGIRVMYVPDAIVTAEMAATARQARSQRTRWEGGRLGLLTGYGPGLIRAIPAQGWAVIDALLDLLTPPLGLLVLLLALCAAYAALLHPAVLTGICILAVLIVFYVCAGLYLRKAPPAFWKALLLAPLYLAWKVPVYLTMILMRTPQSWVRTQRSAETKETTRDSDES